MLSWLSSYLSAVFEMLRIYQEMRGLGLSPGTKLFLNDVNLTKEKGFGEFNLAGKWKKTYRGFPTKEPLVYSD